MLEIAARNAKSAWGRIDGLGVFMWLNPMAPIIRSLSSTVDHAELPDATVFFAGLAWAALASP